MIQNRGNIVDDDLYLPEHNRMVGKAEDYERLMADGYAIGELNKDH